MELDPSSGVSIKGFPPVSHPFLALCGFLLVVPSTLWGQAEPRRDLPKALIIVPAALDIEMTDESYRFSEGCYRLKYSVVAPYPGSSAIKFISDELSRAGWKRAESGARAPYRGAPRRLSDWGHYNFDGGKVYFSAGRWVGSAGDVVSYQFWYFSPDRQSLSVQADYCSPTYVEKRRCNPKNAISADNQSYSVALNIKKIEPVDRDFKVFVEIENNSPKPVQLGFDGDLPDGSPELWDLEIEQQDEDGKWESVGGPCKEHYAFDWITLGPGKRLNGWALAVDFPEANHAFGVCRRKVAHVHGPVRARISFYADACEIENPSSNPTPREAISEPIDLP